MRNLKFFLAILFLFSGFSVATQELDFENYSVDEGLARSGVFDIIQDHNGLLVIGTEGGGVCFFDGVKFRTFNKQNGLIDNNVRRVFQDSDSGYWFGTPKGVTYLGTNGVQNFTIEDGLEDDFVRYIEEDDQRNIWISTNNGVSVFNLDDFKLEKKSKFNFSLPHRRVRSLLFDGKNMWFGTDAGLGKLNANQELAIYTSINGLTHNRVLCLAKGLDDEILVGTNGGLTIMKDNEVLETYTMENGLVNDQIQAVCVNDKGIVYLGTQNGFSILNRKNGVIVTLTEKNGLANDRIRNLLLDDHQNLWIGTYFGGIMKFTPGDFFSITKANGIAADAVLQLFEDDNGEIIVGTIDGVTKMTLKNNLIEKLEIVGEEQGLIFPEVNDVTRDSKGYNWYGTSSGISVFKDGQHVRNIDMDDEIVDSDVGLIKEINPDEMWVGTVDGLSIIKVKSRAPFEFEIKNYSKSDGLSGRLITLIEKDTEGNILIGYREGAIDVFKADQILKPHQDKELREINTGFKDKDGNIWAGTEGEGLFRLTYLADKMNIESQRITKEQGIISDFIYSIAQSQNGNLWLGTEKGVAKIVFQKEGKIEYVRNYGARDGFTGMECNVNSILCDSKGNLWFGTVRGIHYLTKENENGVKKEAVLRITGIESNGFNFDWFKSALENGNFNAPSTIEIPYSKNYIEITFKALFLSSPEKVEYSWKFKNQNEWSTYSHKDFIHFTNLDPGVYTVQIRSRTPENVVSSEPLEFTFTITEPFYMNLGFRIFLIALLLGFGYLIYLWRVRNLKRQKLALEKIVDERTEEISAQNEQLFLKNTEITDSINYAKRIQDTIIPAESKLKSLLGQDSFVLFKPKDIVSGDFYWIREVDQNTTIFCVADCTGHGVPGAMVSLVGVNALNKAVGEFGILKPSEILDKVNLLLNEAFSSEGKSVSDGMDIALCKITREGENVWLEFSGGNNPLWVFNPGRNLIPDEASAIHNEEDEMIGFAIRPNKFGLGKDFADEKFTNHKMELLKGDEVVIFTDGYADQFGGRSVADKPMGKKFKYSRLKQLIFQIYSESAELQKETLDATIEEWRGELEQIDDICLMGVKI
ncbi:MAG: two-component regulator propeller domain-containing protein [Crocinitomicaceae bacterium]